jgi:hypothetical protein
MEINKKINLNAELSDRLVRLSSQSIVLYRNRGLIRKLVKMNYISWHKLKSMNCLEVVQYIERVRSGAFTFYKSGRKWRKKAVIL